MSMNVPYYIFDEEGKSDSKNMTGEAYIDDNDLRDLLIELLGDKISEAEIQEILDAASDENMSEEDFDNMVDEFILKNKK